MADPPDAPPARDLEAEISALASRVAELEAAAERERTAATERERALADREAKLAALFEKAPRALALTRLADGAIVSVNAAFERLFGFPARDVVGRTSVELGITPADGRVAVGDLLAREGAVQGFVCTRRTRAGEERLLSLDLELVPLADGPHVVTSIDDVTDRTRAREALRRGEERMAFHLDNLPMGVVEWDARYVVLRWSKQAERLFGYTAAETIGKPLAELALVHLDDLPVVAGTIERLSGGAERTVSATNRNVSKSGEVLLCTWHNSVQLDDEGRMASVLSIVEDITERTRAEAGMREANEALAEADRRKSDFLAMLSHELRNPLGAIRSALHVLGRAAPDSPPAKRALAVLDRQARHLTRQVEDLLDVTRIARGKLRIDRAPVDVGEIASQVVEDYRAAFDEAGVALEAAPAAEPLELPGDATRLAQLVGNLLHNAAKFTPRGGRTEVSVARDAATGEAVIRVADTGAGIAPGLLPRVFEPFAQAETSLDRGAGGLGLGLALVAAIAKLHGGSARAASGGCGEGAEITVRLPLAGVGG
jgi:PAS domain S-box-containing protein